MALLIAYPWAAALFAVACGALWLWRRSRIAAAAAVAWGGYGVYEYLMYARVLCSGECNIRVDLLLIYPALALVTLAALVASIRSRA